MQRLLTGKSILDAVRDTAKHSQRAWLASGFIKSGFISKLGLNADSDLQVISRWRLFDLASGASDIEAGTQTLASDGAFWIHPRLHAKVLIFDEAAFVGSANLTSSGLPVSDETGNIEACMMLPISSELLSFFEGLRTDATSVDQSLIESISIEVEELRVRTLLPNLEAASAMPSSVEAALSQQKVRHFTGADFPWSSGPYELTIKEDVDSSKVHDAELLSVEIGASFEECRDAFLSSRCYAWLIAETAIETRFGELTSRLHSALDGNPRPYRRDVKQLLRILIAWALTCDPDRFIENPHRHTSSFRSISPNPKT